MLEFIWRLLGLSRRPMDRRRGPRFSDNVVAVMELRGQELRCRIVDVGEGGVRLASNVRLEAGRTLLVRAPTGRGCTHLPLIIKRVQQSGRGFELSACPDPNYPVARTLLNNYYRRFARNVALPKAA